MALVVACATVYSLPAARSVAVCSVNFFSCSDTFCTHRSAREQQALVSWMHSSQL